MLLCEVWFRGVGTLDLVARLINIHVRVVEILLWHSSTQKSLSQAAFSFPCWDVVEQTWQKAASAASS